MKRVLQYGALLLAGTATIIASYFIGAQIGTLVGEDLTKALEKRAEKVEVIEES